MPYLALSFVQFFFFSLLHFFDILPFVVYPHLQPHHPTFNTSLFVEDDGCDSSSNGGSGYDTPDITRLDIPAQDSDPAISL